MQTILHHLLNNNITNPTNIINHQTNSNQNTMKHYYMMRQRYGKNMEQPLVEMYNYTY